MKRNEIFKKADMFNGRGVCHFLYAKWDIHIQTRYYGFDRDIFRSRAERR